MGQGLAVLASGMVTGVGLNAPGSCAAIRCGINNFQETRFMSSGEWIVGSEVPLEQPWRGVEKLVHLAVPAIRECLAGINERPDRIVLLLCVAEKERAGRLPGLDECILKRIESELGVKFSSQSTVIPQGRIAGVVALDMARTIVGRDNIKFCVIAGVDTFLVASTLSTLEEQERILTNNNSDGFIPGEAGAAVLVGAGNERSGEDRMVCAGIGFGREKATVMSGEPLRADGLVEAIKAALSAAGMTLGDIDYRICDVNGERYGFKEASLALTRILRVRKERFDIWHPVDCIGEVGAATVHCCLAVALAAATKGYAPGDNVLCHFASDTGERAALVLSHPSHG